MARVQILGVEVDRLTLHDLNDVVREAVTSRRRAIVAHHNAHSAYLYHRDSKMRDFYKSAARIHLDGMSLVLIGKVLGLPLAREHRVTYVDWLPLLMAQASQSGHRVFFLGSAPGVAERAATKLKAAHRGLEIATHHGYFSGSANGQAAVLSRIREFRPDILMVGMGMPQQEHWVVDHIDCIDAPVILTAGACMDYVAGQLPTSPRWMGAVGLEWLHRLVTRPRRVWRRYLIEPWFLLPLFAKDLLRRR